MRPGRNIDVQKIVAAARRGEPQCSEIDRHAFRRANAGTHVANEFAHSEKMIALYVRYDAQLHRHYQHCPTQLQDLQNRDRLTAQIQARKETRA